MALRRLCPLLAAALLAAAPAGASAASASPVVALTACDADSAAATFRASMRTLPDGPDMAMRFVLQAREPGERWTTVRAPGFGRWVAAVSGRSRFVYAKTVEGLTAPQEYRVRVAFRWRDADGETVRRSTRRSATCEQPDERPDLVGLALDPVSGGWSLTVSNEGTDPAPASAATLTVGTATARLPVPALASGAEATLRFAAPACAPGSSVMAELDPDDAVDEADEDANVLTAACPS